MGMRPAFLSIELPGNVTEALRLVQLLGDEGLNYRQFKICRQRIFNLRLAKGERYAASGPFGEAATDFIRGNGWWRHEEMSRSLFARVQWERVNFNDWFDLHARL